MSGNSNRIAGSNPKRKANKAAMGIVCFAYETSSAEKYHFAAFVDYGDRDIHTQLISETPIELRQNGCTGTNF